VFPAQTQRHAARRRHLQPGAGGEELGHERRCGDYVLEVVEHEQRPLLPEYPLQALQRRRSTDLYDT
jgi:hypothetical protein